LPILIALALQHHASREAREQSLSAGGFPRPAAGSRAPGRCCDGAVADVKAGLDSGIVEERAQVSGLHGISGFRIELAAQVDVIRQRRIAPASKTFSNVEIPFRAP